MNFPESLRAYASLFQHDNHSASDPGYCDPGLADWSVELLAPEAFTSVFASSDAALDWLASEIRMAADDGLQRDWDVLLTEDIKEEVVVLLRDTVPFIWDGFHRVAASVATGRPIRAIVGRPRDCLNAVAS